MQRLLREPLFHFLLLGGAIFWVYLAFYEPAARPMNVITIGPERIEQLSRSFQAAWQRPPSSEELEGVLENEVRDEVYYREAIALGLDTNDTIIRRRLRQKLEFLADSGAGLLKPVEGELEAYLLANEVAFQIPPRAAFEQVYLGSNPTPEKIDRSLHQLRGAAPGDEPLGVGVATVLPAGMSLSSPQAVDAVFGEGFFARLAQLPNEHWSGPIVSTFGIHLVRINEMVAARTPPLEEIREALLLDWKAGRAREIRELHYAKLREGYVVEIHRAEKGDSETR